MHEWSDTEQATAPMIVDDFWSHDSKKLLTNLQELIEVRRAREAFPAEMSAAERGDGAKFLMKSSKKKTSRQRQMSRKHW